MSRSGLRYLVLIGLLCLGGWGLMRVFTAWRARVPQPANAATQVLGHPYLGDRDSGFFHRRRCSVTNGGSERSRFTRRQNAEHLVGFESRADAIEAGYYPCEECDP